MSDTDKKPAKPAPANPSQKIWAKDTDEELDKETLDGISGGFPNIIPSQNSGPKNGRNRPKPKPSV